jgi:hypothetical protein
MGQHRCGVTAVLCGLSMLGVCLPFLWASPSEAVANGVPAAALSVVAPAPITARVSVDAASPVEVELPIAVSQYYTTWPAGLTSPDPTLSAVVSLNGTDTGSLVLDQVGLAVEVTSLSASSLRVTGASGDVATALASRLTWQVPMSAGTVTLSVEAEHSLPANVHYRSASHHLYRVMTVDEDLGGDQNWLHARSTATSTNLWGLTGYLASVTSEEENLFIADLVRPPSGVTVRYWLGGTDADSDSTEGVWRWVDGPEAQDESTAIFWTATSQSRGQRGSVTVGAETRFAWWADGEPNDGFLGEDRLRINVTHSDQLWFDQHRDPSTRSTGAIVEYGLVPQVDAPHRASSSVVLTVRSRFDHLIDFANANGVSDAFPLAPDAAEWTQAGVSGVTTPEFTASLLSVLALDGISGAQVDSVAKLQAIVDAYAAVLSYASSSGATAAPTSAQWAVLGVTGLNSAVRGRLNAEVASVGMSAVDSGEKLVALAASVAVEPSPEVSEPPTTVPPTTVPPTTVPPNESDPNESDAE